MKKYHDLKDEMQTGDLILFEGEYSFSKVIEWIEGCPFSHIGIVFRDKTIQDDPMIFEATSLINLPDLLPNGKNHKIAGPKIVDLYQRLKHYGEEIPDAPPAKFAYRKLSNVDRTNFSKIVLDLHSKYYGHPDPNQYLMILQVYLGRLLKIKTTTKTFFCSQLAALTYINLQLLSKEYPCNAYAPKDFTSKGKLGKLINGTFDDEQFFDL